jgi:crotonobetainyl-CoA:carnitine CoA-transferase CaiB-like acyl-CoA transferase
MPGALHGLKVLDCTHVIAGAWCSLMLADLGADVIKIESPEGEGTRGNPDSAFKPFDFVNRNKRAIALDVTKPEGAAIVRRLAETADIFVENYRVGAMTRNGLGYEDIKRVKPDIIYCSISGFGQTGPYKDRGGFDLITQAMSGIMSFTGEIGSTTPTACGVPVSDLNAGLYGALSILAALQHKAKTGEGQYVETSLLEAALSYTVWETGKHLMTGEVANRSGSRHRLAAPYEALKTGDGHMVVGVNSQRLWAKLCKALGDSELENDPLFAKKYVRLENRDKLQVRLEAILSRATTDEWVTRLTAEGVPCGRMNTIAEALQDPQVKAREVLTEIDGRKFPRAPMRMSKTPVGLKRGSPRIGQHTHEVLSNAGLSASEIKALAASGTIRLDGASS